MIIDFFLSRAVVPPRNQLICLHSQYLKRNKCFAAIIVYSNCAVVSATRKEKENVTVVIYRVKTKINLQSSFFFRSEHIGRRWDVLLESSRLFYLCPPFVYYTLCFCLLFPLISFFLSFFLSLPLSNSLKSMYTKWTLSFILIFPF